MGYVLPREESGGFRSLPRRGAQGGADEVCRSRVDKEFATAPARGYCGVASVRLSGILFESEQHGTGAL